MTTVSKILMMGGIDKPTSPTEIKEKPCQFYGTKKT